MIDQLKTLMPNHPFVFFAAAVRPGGPDGGRRKTKKIRENSRLSLSIILRPTRRRWGPFQFD